jgi:putative serine protease PepD
VYDAQGDIITDEHVVANATKVTVNFQNGKSYPAKVLGTDASTDVAVIKVEGAPSDEIHPLKFADSDSAQVGDPVVAIGSPFGYPETVTSGIVSQTGRTIQAPNGWQIADAIQTDAAINPGNSGGPLLNANGEVIGLNDQIETDGSSSSTGEGQSSGIGFATPGNTDVTVADQIIKTGAAIHPYLGVSLQAAKNGAEVAQILPDSPGGKAGLQVNDVITKVNSTAVTGSEQLITALNKFNPGDSVTLTVQRQGQTKQVKVTLTNRPENALGNSTTP